MAAYGGKDKFENTIKKMREKQAKNVQMFSDHDYNTFIQKMFEIKREGYKWKPQDYGYLKRFQVLQVEKDGELQHILVKPGTNLRYVTFEGLYDAISEIHEEMKHRGRAVTYDKIKERYANITVKHLIAFIEACETCSLRKKRAVVKNMVVKPLARSRMRNRLQIDFIDMRSETYNGFEYILVIQDQVSKFCRLKAVKTTEASEIAEHLVEHFSIFSAPIILHSDNGREFVSKVIKEIQSIWPYCKMVNGNVQGIQADTGIQDIEEMLSCWKMDTERIDWPAGLRFIQYTKNTKCHEEIMKSPYEAMFGHSAQLGLKCLGLEDEDLETEEDLEKLVPWNVDDSEKGDNGEEEVLFDQESESNMTLVENNISENLTAADYADMGYSEVEPESQDAGTNYKEDDFVSDLLCFSCNVTLAIDDSIPCETCSSPCHSNPPCLIMARCRLCCIREGILRQRKGTKKRKPSQVEMLLGRSSKLLKSAQVGDTELLARGLEDFQNLVTSVLGNLATKQK